VRRLLLHFLGIAGGVIRSQTDIGLIGQRYGKKTFHCSYRHLAGGHASQKRLMFKRLLTDIHATVQLTGEE
jgi:hypothetical protein